MEITQADMDIGRRIISGEDPELRDLLKQELAERAKPLLATVMIWATVYASKSTEDPKEQEEAKRRFEDAFMYFAGSFWYALECHFPWVRRDTVRASRYSGKPNWVIMEALGIHVPLDFTWKIQAILGNGPETGFALRKLLELFDATLDSVYDEYMLNCASDQDIVRAAERILRSA